MLYFLIPLISKEASNNWDVVCRLFNHTLWSCYNQTDPNFRIIVACHDIPFLSKEYDSRLEFLTISKEEAPIPKTQKEKMIDKGYKTHTLAMRLRELGAGYAMLVDADDIVSNRLAAFINHHPNENGYYIKTGYVYFYGDHYMKTLPKYSGGTAHIINYSIDDLPDCYPQIMTENCDDNPWIIRKRHGGIVSACKKAGRPLRPLPFKGAIYVLGSGENHSAYGKSPKYQTSLRKMVQFFQIKHPIKGNLAQEFSIDWI